MARFRYDPTFTRRLQRQPEFVAAFDRLAEQGEEIAKQDAPVDEGTFRDSLKGEVVSEDGVTKARISSDDPKWPYLEFGTSDTPTFATLRRMLDQLEM